jgi:hypothetical protein
MEASQNKTSFAAKRRRTSAKNRGYGQRPGRSQLARSEVLKQTSALDRSIVQRSFRLGLSLEAWPV